MVLEFQSSWLANGARLDLQELRAGYAEVPQDVLKGVTFSVEPRMKVAVVGTTGCGKSSMLCLGRTMSAFHRSCSPMPRG